jgi:hypothetical protein
MKTAVEWLEEQLINNKELISLDFQQAKEMEKKQLFLSANTQAKQAYKAGQKSMYCGCY